MFKTKDIRDRIKTMGFERGAVYSMEAMNEMIIQTRRDLVELAQHFDKLVSSFDGMLHVAARMKETIEKRELKEEELGPNTHSLDKPQ